MHLRKEYKSVADITYNIPDIQRCATTEESHQHIDSLYLSYNQYYLNHGEYCIPGAVLIGILGHTEYLIDGQHRLAALKRLCANFPERPMTILIDYYDNIPSEDALNDLYSQVNFVIPNTMTRMEKNVYKITNELEKRFEANFKEYLVKTDRPRAPNVNTRKILEYINDNNIIERANISDADDFYNRILALNKFYASTTDAQFATWKVTNATSALGIIRSKQSQLYIGLYKNFEWIQIIVAAHVNGTGYDTMCHYDASYRPKITKKLRNAVWGSKLVAGVCYVCGDATTNTDFECAHVIPVCAGGATTLENLRPTCRGCNKDMGTMNLDAYVRLHREQKLR